MTRGCRTRLLVASSPETQHRSPPLPSLDFFLHRPRLSLDLSRHCSLSFSVPSKTSDHYNSGPLTLGFARRNQNSPYSLSRVADRLYRKVPSGPSVDPWRRLKLLMCLIAWNGKFATFLKCMYQTMTMIAGDQCGSLHLSFDSCYRGDQ